MINKVKEYKYIIIGFIVGAVAGWCYWYFIGCASGTCPITSRPFNSSAYGAVMGGLLFSTFKKEKTNKK